MSYITEREFLEKVHSEDQGTTDFITKEYVTNYGNSFVKVTNEEDYNDSEFIEEVHVLVPEVLPIEGDHFCSYDLEGVLTEEEAHQPDTITVWSPSMPSVKFLPPIFGEYPHMPNNYTPGEIIRTPKENNKYEITLVNQNWFTEPVETDEGGNITNDPGIYCVGVVRLYIEEDNYTDVPILGRLEIPAPNNE